MTARLHSCAAEGCDKQIAAHLLMCITHWRMVPAALQREVKRTWRIWSRDSGPFYSPYLDAVRNARAAVREKEIKRSLKNQQHGDVLNFE